MNIQRRKSSLIQRKQKYEKSKKISFFHENCQFVEKHLLHIFTKFRKSFLKMTKTIFFNDKKVDYAEYEWVKVNEKPSFLSYYKIKKCY